MDSVQQRLQIGCEISFIVGSRLAIDSCRTVFTSAAVRFTQPFQINQVSEACENQLRRTLRQLGYPMLFQ
jgi:hypothetical protein